MGWWRVAWWWWWDDDGDDDASIQKNETCCKWYLNCIVPKIHNSKIVKKISNNHAYKKIYKNLYCTVYMPQSQMIDINRGIRWQIFSTSHSLLKWAAIINSLKLGSNIKPNPNTSVNLLLHYIQVSSRLQTTSNIKICSWPLKLEDLQAQGIARHLFPVIKIMNTNYLLNSISTPSLSKYLKRHSSIWTALPTLG